MKVVICGGAGYIGSHLVREMTRHGADAFEIIVVDSLEATKGFHDHLPSSVALEVGDVRDEAFIEGVFTKHAPVDAVVHMCASIVVPDSVRDPLAYYDNNIVGALRIARAMERHGVKQLVFSSTAALFGTPDHALIEPDDKKQPESPYGETKYVTELMYAACDVAYGMRTVALRYFNACGADRDGDIGETHDPETHLIPIVLQVPLGKRPHVTVFGTDYATPDGTCVRDYVHVTDLASAHIKALQYLAAGGKSNAFNLGSGDGYSVRQIVEACRRVTGHAIPTMDGPRRPGDPPALVASSVKAKSVLGWEPQYTTIDAIVESAWKFHQSHPAGYSGARKCC